MQLRHYTYHSATYRAFKEISPNAYSAIMHFFEHNKPVVKSLPVNEYFELYFAYTNALYELKCFDKHLLHSKRLLEESIEDNIHFVKDVDIYKTTLFQRGVSLYFIDENELAIHHFKELYRLDHSDPAPLKMMMKALVNDKKKKWGVLKQLAMLSFMVSMVLLSTLFVYVNMEATPFIEIFDYFLLANTGLFIICSVIYMVLPKAIAYLAVRKWQKYILS